MAAFEQVLKQQNSALLAAAVLYSLDSFQQKCARAVFAATPTKTQQEPQIESHGTDEPKERLCGSQTVEAGSSTGQKRCGQVRHMLQYISKGLMSRLVISG